MPTTLLSPSLSLLYHSTDLIIHLLCHIECFYKVYTGNISLWLEEQLRILV